MPRTKRIMDVALGTLGLLVASPVLLIVAAAVWLQDRHSPLYVPSRIGKGGRPFKMVKLRSMVVEADRVGVDSTAAGDPRITAVGRLIRQLKLDEVSQLWNVVRGDMSLVGPRPQVERDARLYTDVERRLLEATPGITDFASIVFADEGEILRGASDPDLRYHQVIRPWKSRLALHYLAKRNTWLDFQLVGATALNAARRSAALSWVAKMLEDTGAEARLVSVARRVEPLVPYPPPGAAEVVTFRP